MVRLKRASYDDPYLVLECDCGHVDKEFVPNPGDFTSANKAEQIQLIRWLRHVCPVDVR